MPSKSIPIILSYTVSFSTVFANNRCHYRTVRFCSRLLCKVLLRSHGVT